MDFHIDSDVVEIGDSLVKFIDREVLPIEHEYRDLLASPHTYYGEDGRFKPKLLELQDRIRMRSAELGFYNLFGAADLGGSGLGAVAGCYIQELLNHRYGPARILVRMVVLPSPFTNGLTPVLRHMRPEVFERYREGIATGRKTLCFGLSEPDAGSDVFGIKTTATQGPDGSWTVNGTKQWITNGPYADHAMVFAVTDKEKAARRKGGISCFFVDTKAKGYSISRPIAIMGDPGSDTCIITLDQVRVADDHMIGRLDEGLAVAMDGVNAGRLSMAASNLGLARWALDLATEYAKTRKVGGKLISEHQAVQFLLADCASEIYASKCMIQNCAWRVDQGLPSTKENSMVKLHATEMLNRVMDRCIQVHGGMGLTNELRLEAGYRFARILRIPDGTSEIQRKTIARELLRGSLDF